MLASPSRAAGRVGAQRRIETPDAATLAALAGEHLDLVQAPFTLPRSRVLVFREGDGVRVHTSEYERSLDDCRVLDAPRGARPDGVPLPITGVLPHVVEFGGGVVDAQLRRPGRADHRARAPTLVRTRDGRRWTRPRSTRPMRIGKLAPGATTAVRFDIAPDRTVGVAASGAHPADLAATETLWLDWFARCPRVRDDLQPMTAFCWWVLGANIVELPALGRARAVVPSKIGYVGLWQWDAYFIAVGLRHGDPELAREQLELAFRFPSADGQLPDVVHEHGVLATSDDLPPGDRENLRRAGSAIADPSAPVPLTKPPLAAWALAQGARGGARRRLGARAARRRSRRSQDWWFVGIRPRRRRHARVRASVLLRARRQPDLRRPAADDGARPRRVPRAAGPRARPPRRAPTAMRMPRCIARRRGQRTLERLLEHVGRRARHLPRTGRRNGRSRATRSSA